MVAIIASNTNNFLFIVFIDDQVIKILFDKDCNNPKAVAHHSAAAARLNNNPTQNTMLHGMNGIKWGSRKCNCNGGQSITSQHSFRVSESRTQIGCRCCQGQMGWCLDRPPRTKRIITPVRREQYHKEFPPRVSFFCFVQLQQTLYLGHILKGPMISWH